MSESDPAWTDGQRDFWATKSAFPGPDPDNAANDPGHHEGGKDPARERQVREEPCRVSCLLIGPEGSGKSSFIAAIEQASLMARREPATGMLTASLATGPGPGWTDGGRPTTYRFDVHHHPPTGSATTCELRIREQTGSLFRTRERLDHGQVVAWPAGNADQTRRCLVMVVDPFNAIAGRWREILPDVLRRLSSTAKPDAVFVAISKGDLLCDQIRRIPLLPRTTGFRPRARDIALRIDPWRQAVEILGNASLELLRVSVPKPQDLAVGIVSACGFDPETGGAIPAPPDGDLRPGWGTAPFGIHEALRFLVLGEVAGRLSSPETSRRRISHWHRITV